MESEVKNASPLIVCFAPDEYFSVVGGGGENVAVFWVCPGDRPYCAFVSEVILAAYSNVECLAYRERVYLRSLMGPRILNAALMGLDQPLPFQCFCQTMCFSFYLENLNCSVGGAGCQPATIVIENCIVLWHVLVEYPSKEAHALRRVQITNSTKGF